MVKVTLEKVNYDKLKFTMVNGTRVIPNFQFALVNLTLIIIPYFPGATRFPYYISIKVDLTPDNNLVTKKGWVHLLSI